VRNLGIPLSSDNSGPVWQQVGAEAVLNFLREYQVDPEARSLSLPLICSYIERQLELGELSRWTIAVRGRESLDRRLGESDLQIPGNRINQISRTRLSSDPDSLGVITSPGDEGIGLSADALARARALMEEEHLGDNPAARRVRDVAEGLLLLYPISRNSGYDLQPSGARRPIYDNPNDVRARDIIGLAVSFPYSERAQRITGQYTVGTVGWRAV
jgi:hypothetical protein